jgi:hypothetical protein
MPVVSAGATRVIGNVFLQHFASGGTPLDFNPGDYPEFIKTQKGEAGYAVRSGAARCSTPKPPLLPAAHTGHNGIGIIIIYFYSVFA